MALGGFLPGTPAVDVAVIAVATGIIWLGSGWLETAAEELSAHYGLPDLIQGPVVVAVGSSSPELASVLVTALAGAFDMGVGAILIQRGNPALPVSDERYDPSEPRNEQGGRESRKLRATIHQLQHERLPNGMQIFE